MELAEKWIYKKVGKLMPKDLEDEQPTSCGFRDGIVLLLPEKFCKKPFEEKRVEIAGQTISSRWGWSADSHFHFATKGWRGYWYQNEKDFLDDLMKALNVANDKTLAKAEEGEEVELEKKQETLDLEKSRDRYIQECSKRLKNIKKEKESEIKSDEEEMKAISRRLVELTRKVDESKRIISGLVDKRDFLEKYGQEYDKLLELPRVEKVLVKNGTITVFTDTIYLPFEGEIYEMGEYQIIFERNVRIINERPIFNPRHGTYGQWFHHPHVFEEDGHNTCLGNITLGIRELVGKYEYAVATQVLIDFLHTCKYPHYLTANWKPMKKKEALWA